MNITYYKALAVFITALMGCFAGAYLSHLYGWVGLSLLAMDFSIFPLAAVVVGAGDYHRVFLLAIGLFLIAMIAMVVSGWKTRGA